MGSYHSLWVTDPYDLEIGSSNATISTHTHIYTGAAKGARGSHVARDVLTPASAERRGARHGSGERSSEQSLRERRFSRCAHTNMHSHMRCAPGMCMTVHPPIGGPLSALLGLATNYFACSKSDCGLCESSDVRLRLRAATLVYIRY